TEVDDLATNGRVHAGQTAQASHELNIVDRRRQKVIRPRRERRLARLSWLSSRYHDDRCSRTQSQDLAHQAEHAVASLSAHDQGIRLTLLERQMCPLVLLGDHDVEAAAT